MTMTTVQQLEQFVAKLPPLDLAEFRRWFAEFDAAAWDAQIEADAAAGKLDVLAKAALQEHLAGKARESALSLPDGDRVQLVETLLASLQPHDQPPFAESWRAVIQRRSQELLAGQVTPVPWAEVREQARSQRGG